jgi:hypothetical protein
MLKKTTLVFFGCAVSLLILYAFNLYCKFKLKNSGFHIVRDIIQLDPSLSQFVVPAAYINFHTDKLIIGMKKNPRKWVDLDYSQTYAAERPGMPNSNHQTFNSKLLKLENREVVFDVNINFDSAGRRVVKNPISKKNKIGILFLGGSFTFGEGVNDYESFPSIVSEKLPKANVYNNGKSGGSINQIYYDLTQGHSESFFSIKENKIILVYTFISHHLLRQYCDIRCLGINDWILKKPKYILVNNKIEFKGFFKDFFVTNSLTDLIFKSSIFTYYDFGSSQVYGDENLNLATKLLDSIREEYSKRFQVVDFYIYFHDSNNNSIINNFARKLLAARFKLIIANKYEITQKFGNATMIPFSWHPSALGHEVIANSISGVLKMDHPELAPGPQN